MVPEERREPHSTAGGDASEMVLEDHSGLVRFALIGALSVVASDSETALRMSPRARLVLGCLVLAPEMAQTREALASAIWGDHVPDSGKASLRNAVSEVRAALRAALSDERVTISFGSGVYRVTAADGTRVTVDVLVARDAAAALPSTPDPEATLAAAMLLADGLARELLPGVSGPWVEQQRHELAADHARLIRVATQAALALGDYELAERLGQDLVALDPLRDDGVRLLMSALRGTGNQASATVVYDTFRRRLSGELGVVPAAATRALFEEIVVGPDAHDRPEQSPTGSPAASGAGPGWRRTLRYALPASRAALAAGMFEEAARLTEGALDALQRAGDPSVGDRLALTVVLGAAKRGLGDPTARSTLLSVHRAATEQGDAGTMVAAALALTDGGAASEHLLIDDQLLELYQATLAAIGPEQLVDRVALLGRVASAYAWRQDGRESRRLALEALRSARGVGDEDLLGTALTTAHRALTGAGKLEQQDSIEREMLSLAQRRDDPGLRASALLWQFATRTQQGSGQPLEGLLVEAEVEIEDLPTGDYRHSLAYSRAALAILRGSDDAEARINAAAQLGRTHGLDPVVSEGIRLAQLMVLRLGQGRLADVRDEFASFFVPLGVTEYLASVAFLDAEAGEYAGVADRIGALFAVYAASGATATASVAQIAWMARPIARIGDRVLAQELHGFLEPFSGQGAFPGVFAGPVDYHLGLVEHVLGDGAAAGRRFAAAEGFCKRLGAPVWVALCREAATGRGPFVAV